MKLVYCNLPNGNFGDDLNLWFWDRFAPGLLDNDDSICLIGIGTLIQDYFFDPLSSGSLKVIVGAGAGYGALPKITNRWRIYGVRGPLTASYYDLPPEKVLTDPAMLVADCPELRTAERGGGIGFMPHVSSTIEWNWRATCEKLGLIYVDPEADSKETIFRISGLQRLVTEAMHGAIVADAFRVPWIAAPISPGFEPTKWCDWAASLGMRVHFRPIPFLTTGPRPLIDKLKLPIKKIAVRFGYKPEFATWPRSTMVEVAYAEQELYRLANSASAQLSDEAKLYQALDRMREALITLVSDAQSGKLTT